MPQITVTRVVKKASGKVYVSFGKETLEFSSVSQMQDWADGILSRETMKAMCVALMLSRQPALNNPSVFEGRGLDADFNRPTNVVQVT